MSDSGPPPKRRKLDPNPLAAPPTSTTNLSPEAAAVVARIKDKEKRRIVAEVLASVADLPPTIDMSQLHSQLKPVPDMDSGASYDEIKRVLAENKAAIREAKRQNAEVDWAVQAALDRLQDFYEDTPDPAERARRVHENWDRQFQRMQRNLWRCCR